jgi:hypothetical protein
VAGLQRRVPLEVARQHRHRQPGVHQYQTFDAGRGATRGPHRHLGAEPVCQERGRGDLQRVEHGADVVGEHVEVER